MPDYANFLSAAREAVVAASGVTRQVQAALDDVRAITKDDRSPVTVADYAAQAIVALVLREKLGEFVLVGEEHSELLRDDDHAVHREAALAAVREVFPDITADGMLDAIDLGAADTSHHGFWTLDPVDGTKGFLRGQQYAISLGYIEGAVPVVGALACPNLPLDFGRGFDDPDGVGSCYLAIKGDGCAESRADSATGDTTMVRRVEPEAGAPLSVCASVEQAHTKSSDVDNVMAKVGPPGEPARLDSQAKYAVVARGQADAYLRLPTRKGYVERIWDHAAGALVANEAGAAVTDIAGNQLDFGQGRGLEKNRGVICAPPRVHSAIIGALDELGLSSMGL